MARRVAIAQLKARLSEYVAAAKSGEEVVITERGRPVARLTPMVGAAAQEGRQLAINRRHRLRFDAHVGAGRGSCLVGRDLHREKRAARQYVDRLALGRSGERAGDLLAGQIAGNVSKVGHGQDGVEWRE